MLTEKRVDGKAHPDDFNEVKKFLDDVPTTKKGDTAVCRLAFRLARERIGNIQCRKEEMEREKQKLEKDMEGYSNAV